MCVRKRFPRNVGNRPEMVEASVRGWSVLLRGLKAVGLLWAPVHPLPEEPAGGPPPGHPEGWNPHRRVPDGQRELWAQIRTEVR
ncbi:DUF6059 family protein [Actinoplanes sp. NPDC051494]|uniref:DUF6059 family protein n=1 Tax=Actinoplanes sp. NPDC051494 TaxID=3363907 RepID=UPI0037B95B92